MPRKFTESTLLIASGNQGKIREIRELLHDLPINIRASSEFNLSSPEENQLTFHGNALLKARYYCEKTGLPALADDSGLCVDNLDGAPGIYSARWAMEGQDFDMAMKRVEKQLAQKGLNTSTAHFSCALALHWPDGESEWFEGKIEGTLTFPPRGTLGFGYDPIFIPQGHTRTFAEMSSTEKHTISHRARAFSQLFSACFMEN